MYADLEKIEARGKRKKEKKGGLFSFGKKEAEPEPEPAAPQPKPAQEPAARDAEHLPEPRQPEPPVQAKPKPAQELKRAEPKPAYIEPPPPPAPELAPKRAGAGWSPPTGAKLAKANSDLVKYKKWLNRGYKSGVLTKEQCARMVREKEIELGLRPPG